MTTSHRAIAEFDGWIFTSSGKFATKGRNGTNRRLSDLHYDRWEWLMPVFIKLCHECRVEHREDMMKIHSAILLGDKEMAGELMGRLIIEIKKVRV
jgi:hypothetical protein